MSTKRSFDIIVFGATGYTGKYVIEELAKFTPDHIKWGIAGRNQQKLEDALKEVGNTASKNLDHIGIIQADVHIRDTLSNMCLQTRLVINCVGPYRFFGQRVVEECVTHGTHHIDVSGEPQFLEHIQLQFFEAAKNGNVYVIGACGFDSIPCDLGVEHIKTQFEGDVNSIETYLKFNFPKGYAGNFATWQSAIYGIASASELRPLRKELKEKLFDKGQPKSYFSLPKKPVLFKSQFTKKWTVPFIGSDKSIVQRTQMYNYQYRNQRPVTIQTFLTVASLFNAVGVLFMAVMFFVMSRFPIGRHLLEKYPEFFSFGTFSRTPSPRDTADERSFSMTFKANGWAETLSEATDQHTHSPNKSVKCVLSGPDMYITTAICVVNSALVVLEEQEKLPEKGGVFTPGAAFKDTSLMQRLLNRGIAFSIDK